MNYRHAFHAGNFADVVKHVALVAILLHLRKKEKPFRVVDSHAGRGLYDLAGEAAQRTGEAEQGIRRLEALREPLPPALAAYLDIVRRMPAGQYPGSPVIAAELLRANDRLMAIERHPEEAAALSAALAPYRNAKAIEADGYARLASLLPPPERRGLVLIDPPFEAGDEFARMADALAGSRRRFATGIYLLWYPVKSQAAAAALAGEILTGGSEDTLQITIDVGGDGARLTAAGLLVVNPPFGLAAEMRLAADILSPLLGRTGPARIAVAEL